jgi:guanylate kinase
VTRPARVFVITGPSGVGKGTLIRALRERMPELELAVSATTRQARPGESDGVDYHFVSDEGFDRWVADGAFVEHAGYSGRRYGTLREELERRTARGAPVVLEIEVQARARWPTRCRKRCASSSRRRPRTRCARVSWVRGTDDAGQVEARLATAREELAAQDEFGHVVVNDRLEEAVAALEGIVRAATLERSQDVSEPKD